MAFYVSASDRRWRRYSGVVRILCEEMGARAYSAGAEALKASTGSRIGRGYPLPSPTRPTISQGQRRNFPSRVRGGGPRLKTNILVVSERDRTPCCRFYTFSKRQRIGNQIQLAVIDFEGAVAYLGGIRRRPSHVAHLNYLR